MVSIITINYNRKFDVEKTIQSVINQSYKSFEFIIVDGGSTDGSVALISNYQSSITKWISEPDKGIFDAMNKGISMANGDYLLFLNGGDFFLNDDSLKLAMDHANNSSEDIIYGNILVEMSFGGNLVFKYPDKLSFKFFLVRDLPHQATFIKKSLFDKYGGYDITNKINADWSFFILAICKYDATYKHIPCVFTVFQAGGVTESKSKKERIMDQREFLENHFGMFFKDMFDYLNQEQKSIKKMSYKLLANVAKFFLTIYFSLGGKQNKFIENLKP
jgi:glycosyltransferase involved in cell wall biosynthesis